MDVWAASSAVLLPLVGEGAVAVAAEEEEEEGVEEDPGVPVRGARAEDEPAAPVALLPLAAEIERSWASSCPYSQWSGRAELPPPARPASGAVVWLAEDEAVGPGLCP